MALKGNKVSIIFKVGDCKHCDDLQAKYGITILCKFRQYRKFKAKDNENYCGYKAVREMRKICPLRGK